ncbi:SDR family oxidoreductase [Agaribacterium sp. ZY112]|uniref:SDR family oxidoreductase n=1 Tax=Agaribacterium sp. ZY112 TaxID=3233574 RepID=UPI00352388C0
MESKVLLITGASRGIGAEVAILAAQQGWDVALTYRVDQSEAEKVQSKIQAFGQRAFIYQADVSDELDITRVFKQLDKDLGRLDALVNNAGIITKISPFISMSAERIRDVFNINVVGSFLCAQEAVKRMALSADGYGGSIVNMSSAAARIGSPNEFIDYAATKGAIDTMTLGLAKEVGSDGIRVNAVRPGLIATDMHADAGDAERAERLKQFVPMQRVGEPSEVAKAIMWLISDEASYVNGALLDVTGGR